MFKQKKAPSNFLTSKSDLDFHRFSGAAMLEKPRTVFWTELAFGAVRNAVMPTP